jgi:hypothetical protein
MPAAGPTWTIPTRTPHSVTPHANSHAWSGNELLHRTGRHGMSAKWRCVAEMERTGDSTLSRLGACGWVNFPTPGGRRARRTLSRSTPSQRQPYQKRVGAKAFETRAVEACAGELVMRFGTGQFPRSGELVWQLDGTGTANTKSTAGQSIPRSYMNTGRPAILELLTLHSSRLEAAVVGLVGGKPSSASSAWQPLRHTDANVSKPTSVPNRISRTSRAPRAVLAPTRLAPRPDGGVERAPRSLRAGARRQSPGGGAAH